jgi:trehalose 6-phosphate phosphatase
VTYLFSHWDTIAARLRRSPHRLFLFDFDGTLARIVSHPSHTRLHSGVRKMLHRLSGRPGVTVGIISGRSLIEIRTFVGLPDLLYAGNHGLELWDGRHVWTHAAAGKKRSLMRRATAVLSRHIHFIPGAWVENKGLSLSVHFRQAKPSRIGYLKEKVRETLAAAPFRSHFEIQEGKKVLDVRPRVGWDKGSVVKRFAEHLPRRTVLLYVGDDTTDEDAFRVVRRGGIAIRVGESRSSAAIYYLKGQTEIKKLLGALIKL